MTISPDCTLLLTNTLLPRGFKNKKPVYSKLMLCQILKMTYNDMVFNSTVEITCVFIIYSFYS